MNDVLKVLQRFCDEKFKKPRSNNNEVVGQALEKQLFNFLMENLPSYKVGTLKEFFADRTIESIKDQLKNPSIVTYRLGSTLSKKAIIYQPFQTDHPDFLVFSGRRFLPIECKTSTQGRPNFGDTYPRRGYHYIYANLKRDIITHMTGINIEHPENDPEYIRIKQKYLAGIEDLRKYLRTKKYVVCNKEVKWAFGSRSRYTLSAEI